jgi:EAL domain-containing protein (putative c-di-GMP-specific phosphodiesterase class I)
VLLDTLLAPGSLAVVYQPIFSVADELRSVHAFEGLTRGPRGTTMERPDVLFEYARRKGKEGALDRLAVENALRTMAPLQETSALSLNVHASTLERDHRFVSFLQDIAGDCGIKPTSLVVEIVEHCPPLGGPGFRRALAELRRAGVRIALDDVGLGQSNFRMILECEPDYLKIDRYLVQGCHHDDRRRAVLESLVLLARRTSARVVAEGVEERADLAALIDLGIDLAQGFYLAPPASIEACRLLTSTKFQESF